METYQQVLDYMYSRLPMFHRIGAAAYKGSLDNTIALCDYLKNPERQFKSIHVAGTNGKGSSSHMLAAILQSAGYKVGLYTSPHLKSFTERIRINGHEIGQQAVVDFIRQHQTFIDELQPSFFELTVGLAFDYFAREKVDIAVIEVGMGGRLDSTNIIHPEICLITNISYDHQALLGNTLPEIAAEKAGIIKENVPVVVSQQQSEVEKVFKEVAASRHAPLHFASKDYYLAFYDDCDSFDVFRGNTLMIENVSCELKGNYQVKNIAGVLKTMEVLQGFQISKEHIRAGLAKVVTLTGLKGRWQVLSQKPFTVCDTAHNEDGIRHVMKQLTEKLDEQPSRRLHFVIGAVNDKEPDKILVQLPKNATYYFCKPNIPRGLEVAELQKQAAGFELKGEAYASVSEAISAAKGAAAPEDVIFIGGSTFVVAEVEGL